MTKWPVVPLGEVATLQRGYDLPVQNRMEGPVPIYAANGPVGFHSDAKVAGPGVITGRSGSIGKVQFSSGEYWPLNTALYVKDFHGNDPRFVYYLLKNMNLAQYGTGTGVPTLNRNLVHAVGVPLPTLPEQRRIAAILDHVDSLRIARREALQRVETLIEAVFFRMFGPPSIDNSKHPVLTLSEVCAGRFRNGLSPSKAGTSTAKVLTLSAVTGSGFDRSAFKVSTFNAPPPSAQSVSDEDLLICRGNGNLRLVGKGYFSPSSIPDVTFPDTIIAGTVDVEYCDRKYLERIWASPIVRKQIESAARTTNGTYKINQSSLGSVKFPVPPRNEQAEFGRFCLAVEDQTRSGATALSILDALFSSLQSRALNGED